MNLARRAGAGYASLTNPRDDISVVGEALKSVGLEVLTHAQNATRMAMLRAIHEFAGKPKVSCDVDPRPIQEVLDRDPPPLMAALELG